MKLRVPEGRGVIVLFLQRPWMDGGACAGWGCAPGGRGPQRRIALAVNIGQLPSSVPGVPVRGGPRLRPDPQRWPWCHLEEAVRRGPGTVVVEETGERLFCDQGPR